LAKSGDERRQRLAVAAGRASDRSARVRSDLAAVRAVRRQARFPLSERASGVLLHPTSLPGPWGCGDLGPSAHAFAGFLATAGQRFWQMLPVGPSGYGNSPYSAQSAFAGNPLLISLEALVEDGLLEAPRALPNSGRVDYAAAAALRERALRAAFARWSGEGPRRRNGRQRRERDRFEAFRHAQRAWLGDWALYRAIKKGQQETSWLRWPRELRLREPRAIARARRDLRDDILFHEFEQFLFDSQWRRLKADCAALGVGLIGDLPLFVAHDSADVWAHRELFQLDAEGELAAQAGVPPDYFSADGQLWGNPLYRWGRMKRDGYPFWVNRLGLLLERFDAIRLDHFIGFVRYWEIPAGATTAKQGRFRKGPGEELFVAVRSALGELPLIAEDLGRVTPQVTALRDRLGLPGIAVLQFAFGTDPQGPTFLPHNYLRRTIAYTGTHDNDTSVGWYREERGGTRSPAQTERERRAAREYLNSDGEEIHWDMIRGVHASVAEQAIVPMQDLLGLGSEARMNHPGTLGGNWEWRLRPGQASARIARRLAHLTALYGRSAR
jgi:4-alpha-glucanotransferase